MSYSITIPSTETKNFYSNGTEDSGYVVGGDYLGTTLLGRIMRYEIAIPAEVKKINKIKINFQGNGWGFGYGPSGSFDALKDNVYCCFRSSHDLNNLSTDIKVVMLNGNNGPEHWPYTETVSSTVGGTSIDNILKGGCTYYLYVYSKAWNSFGSNHYWRYFGSDSARAQIVLEYEIYSQVTSPTLNSPPTVVVPGGKYWLNWSGASNGTANNITSYKISLGNNSWSFAADLARGEVIIPSGQKRGQNLNWTIQAIGQVTGYDGAVNNSGGCLINTPPNPPAVSVNTDIVSCNGGTVIFSASAGSDPDRHTTSVLYKRKGDDKFIPWDYQGQEIKSTTTFEFVTSDQYEYSTIVEKTIIKNVRPEISCSVDSSITLNPIITVTRKNITGRGNPTYTYKLVYGGKTKTIKANSSSNKLIINDVGEEVEGDTLPDGYKILVSCYDGIDSSAEISSNEIEIAKLLIKDNTGSGNCGKRPKIKFYSSGYYYIRVNGVVSKINNNIATLEFEDNNTDQLLSRSYPIYASVDGINFYNIKQNINFKQVCSLQISRMSLPGSNDVIKPYVNSGSQYAINFIGLENSKNSLEKYFADGVFTSFILRFREINSSNSEIINVPIKENGWSGSTFNFTIEPINLYNTLAKLGLNQNKSHSVICSFETQNGFEDLYTFSQKFIADFRETPEIPQGDGGMHIYVKGKQLYGPQRWSHLQDGMELYLQTYNSSISSYNKISQAVVKIIGKSFSKEIDITENLTMDFSNVSYGTPYEYICNFPFWAIESSLKDDTLEFKLSITTVANTSITKTLIKGVLLQIHYNPKPYFSEITFDATNGLRFKLIPNLRAGYELSKNDSAFKKGNVSFKEDEVKIYVQEEKAEYSTKKEGDWYKVINFEFNQNYSNLHIAPKIESTCTAIATLDNGKDETSFANEKFTEILTYSTVYNVLPTVAYRKNQLGINIQPSSANDSQAAIVVGAYGNKDCIYFYGDGAKSSLNLTTRKIDNFIVDCGSWGTSVDGSFDIGSVITGQLAAIAYSGDIEDLLQGNASNPVIIISGGQA